MFNRYFAVISAVVSAALFGVTTPFNKTLLRSFDPFLLAGLLYLGASAGLLPVVLFRKDYRFLLTLNKANRKRLAGAVLLGGITGPILILFGLKFSSASSVSLWLNLELVATGLLGFFFFKDYLGAKGWTGVALALGSGVILTINEGNTGILSAVLVSLACICWGFDNHFTALIDGISAVQSTFIKGLFAGTVNTILGIIISGTKVQVVFIFYAILLGSISYGVSIVMYIMSAQRLGAVRSQIIFSSAPFFGVLFSMIFLSETLSILQLVSISLFVISIILMMSEKHEHFHIHNVIEHTHLHRHDDLHHDHKHEKNIIYHEHFHQHEKSGHAHPHWPDIHHRHIH